MQHHCSICDLSKCERFWLFMFILQWFNASMFAWLPGFPGWPPGFAGLQGSWILEFVVGILMNFDTWEARPPDKRWRNTFRTKWWRWRRTTNAIQLCWHLGFLIGNGGFSPWPFLSPGFAPPVPLGATDAGSLDRFICVAAHLDWKKIDSE